jgi:hypothetical protein
LCLRTFALFILRTLLNAIIYVCNLILKGCSDDILVSEFLVIDAVRLRSMYFVVMPRVSLIVIIVMYVRYLYSINCPTVIYLPSMLYLWRDITSELWTPVQFPLNCYTVLLYSHCLLYLQTIIQLPLDTLIPLFTANR